MTNEEFVFNQTNKERRNYGAFHKKNGTKSKKCTLPSDRLTPAQLNKLNGPILSLHLEKPMTRTEWKLLRADQRKLYIEHLVEKYNANNQMIAEAIGCTGGYVCKTKKELGIKGEGKGGGRNFTNEQLLAWDKFMNPEKYIAAEAAYEPDEEVPEEVSLPEEDKPMEPTPVQVFLGESQATRIEQTDFAITVSGVRNWSELNDYFNLLPIRAGSTATVRIELHQGK